MASHFDSTEVEWGQFKVFFNGLDIGKIRGLKYSVESEDEELYAGGDEPIDIQSGNRKYSGELKILKGALDGLNEAAVAAGYRDITDVPAKSVSIVATYSPKGNRVLQTDTLMAVKIGKFEKGFDQGAKMMEITLPFKFLKLKMQ